MRFFLSLPFMLLAYLFWKIAFIIHGKPFVIGRKYYDTWKIKNEKAEKLRGFWTNDPDIASKINVNNYE